MFIILPFSVNISEIEKLWNKGRGTLLILTTTITPTKEKRERGDRQLDFGG